MSVAQLLVMQVGEVAEIQVLETVQKAFKYRRGLMNAKLSPVPPCSQPFTWRFSSARARELSFSRRS
jgi:hypothetical protein